MSGIEAIAIVTVVSAVVSAFHGASEMVKTINKRRGRKPAEQALKEKDLQESLQHGHRAVQERYLADYQRFGQPFRTGDDIARNRLLQIAVILQAEIIRSLQLAMQHHNAILNLTVLRDTSAVNREAALTTLSELRQRIIAEMRLAAPFPATQQIPELRRLPSTESIQVFIADMPPGVTITAEPEPRGGIKRLLPNRRSSTTGHIQQGTPSQIKPEPTFEEMVAQLESTQIGNEAQGETGSVRNSSTISAGSANSVHSGRVPSVASVSETTNSASPPSTSTPSTPGVSSPVSPPGPSPSSSTGCVQYQRPPHMRPTIDTRHTIEMPPTGGQLLGRANQKNNYWGFCKGAWSTRESLDEGLRVRTQPEGFFSTVSFWECRHCHFRGERYRTKPEMVDQTIYKTACGIRYRWLFLAKSHTRANSLAQAGQRRGGPNYGCVFCCAEGRPTGVYGDVETLMNHIYPTHGRQMSADIQRRMKCVVGCVADSAGDWDLNIPLAPESEEPRVSEMPADDNNIPVPVPVSRVEPGGTAARRAAGFGPVWCAGSGPLNAPVGGIMFRC